MKAIHDFGFIDIELESRDFLEPDQVIPLRVAPLRIDLLTSLKGLLFTDAWERGGIVVGHHRGRICGESLTPPGSVPSLPRILESD